MGLMSHLGALRKCLIRSFIALAIGMAGTLYFSKELFNLLIAPLQKVLPKESKFIATSPFESYMVYLKTAAFAGLLIAAPYIALEIWRFISPGLFKNEKRLIQAVAISSAVFFVAGGLFGYFFVFPTGFRFIVEILEDTPVIFMPRMSDYFSFSAKLLLAFGVVFELPILIFLLARVGLIQYSHIRKFRKYAIVLIFVIAGVLTPGPDILSQFMMAGPLILFYELGGLAARLFGKKKS